jgi:hypothetical protein
MLHIFFGFYGSCTDQKDLFSSNSDLLCYIRIFFGFHGSCTDQKDLFSSNSDLLCSIFSLVSTVAVQTTHCKKKLTENSASLTGCNRLTCKGDGTFFQHADQVNPTNSYDDDRIFRNQRNFPTDNLTSSDDNDVIFRNQRKFPTVSRSHAKEFPTIFRQLSDGEKESKSLTAPTRFEPTTFRVTTCYSTLPLRHTHFLSIKDC